MAQSADPEGSNTDEQIHLEYILDVRIVEIEGSDGQTRYRFEAPQHEGSTFETQRKAELYADVYFDVNGFEEAGTGDRGVPPEVIQGGKDTMAAYMLTQQYADVHWLASFYGKRPAKIEEYVSWVQDRAEEIRSGARERGME